MPQANRQIVVQTSERTSLESSITPIIIQKNYVWEERLGQLVNVVSGCVVSMSSYIHRTKRESNWKIWRVLTISIKDEDIEEAEQRQITDDNDNRQEGEDMIMLTTTTDQKQENKYNQNKSENQKQLLSIWS